MKANEIKEIITVEIPHQRPAKAHIHDTRADAESYDYEDLNNVHHYTIEEAVAEIYKNDTHRHQGDKIIRELKKAVAKLLVEHGVETSEQRDGCEIDDDGLVQPTYNLRLCRYAFGKIDVVTVQDNGALDEVEVIDVGESTDDYLAKWDEEYQNDFRAEGLLQNG